MASTKQMQLRARANKKKMCTKNEDIFHYTKGIHINKIIDSKQINLEANASLVSNKLLAKLLNRKSFVWFTESQNYPITALPFLSWIPETNIHAHLGPNKPTIDWDKLSDAMGGIYRFKFSTFDSRFIKWKDSQYRIKNLNNILIKGLDDIANMVGDYASKFWISNDIVLLKSCTLEIKLKDKWVWLIKYDANGNIVKNTEFDSESYLAKSHAKRCELELA